MLGTITLNDIAKDLKLSRKTTQRLARKGVFPVIAIKNKKGHSYIASIDEYLNWKKQKQTEKQKNNFLSDWDLLLKEKGNWIEWCKNGLLTGKPQSENTIETNVRYMDYYFNNIPRRYQKTPIISLENLRALLGNIDPQSFSKKDNIYKAIRSFTRYLIAKKLINPNFLIEIKEVKPKRLYPAKKLHCTLEQFNQLLAEAEIKRPGQADYDVILGKVTVATFGFTGLRASELINLRLQDVDLINKKLFVFLGKGNKNRYVGICNRLYGYLKEYLECRPKTTLENFFVTYSTLIDNPIVPLDRDVLLHKIKRLSKKVGFDINLHGLRRTFATIAANAGKPINIISLALGHSDLKTTQGYLMTSQDEVIKEMQSW